jgi:hypothetical protein
MKGNLTLDSHTGDTEEEGGKKKKRKNLTFERQREAHLKPWN